jgi:hypothetical protein
MGKERDGLRVLQPRLVQRSHCTVNGDHGSWICGSTELGSGLAPEAGTEEEAGQDQQDWSGDYC